MDMQIYQQLESLSAAQKIQLGEVLIESAHDQMSDHHISDAQRSELRARMSYHRAHPDEPGVSYEQLVVQLRQSVAARGMRV
jgi:putative addiction module component (TIGR02574 family)